MMTHSCYNLSVDNIGKGDLVEIKVTNFKSRTCVCVDVTPMGDENVYSFIDCVTNESFILKEHMLFWSDYVRFVIRNKSDLVVDA